MSNHSPNPEIIRNMFSKVAANYDKGNNVLSMGIHHLWRKKLVKYSGAKAGDQVLDCATGTGDLAIEFKKTVGTGAVTGTDFCAEMLIPAPGKAKERGLDITFEQADVTQLQYADNSFDVCSISFGIRNVGDPVKALKEMARVTRPGGKVMVLEFGQVNIPVFGALYNFYSQNILPKIGGIVTGQKEAYEYLQKSSAAFPCREGFLDLMKESGAYSKMEYITLTGGIAYIYKGTVK
ncbi:bifunctional demethylmenaquinone methyltransferase/2-methoxy-6-polyprenyl-1,4-benzoquinol methylase UbiE [Bdellovibrio bacteriovorus]|uniref:Ubiquinone/menaquinone biosynthesis C-methyltransferase UbiE n=1 Tax=Bdellovibrio bacteriovorus (strain ATCC 15356 / DSM 50701 / NCIMB 9529 / HD100) TaxID=264462 RepID=UBIE_BDEBA|nr:bifunctional demethylmenaquinone methyltransferase/2-methoxy-6-polyprenyl-1,4-benzoquinol methylase UbiE [Bdellovibrio bacteriovorus]Q6MHQ3.1 RecName: Full=Ubiquinone/menaquinone biosynthesis C-methyltransferase UbiE; AltName: Full=2-methoxy-6-polyprenyl-1,4-benzoquinol methylase; AltName: Full=Demethylmenaquinone methyltransferase [Bdellovibrio bacteriovorus HD100]AHZ83838.1 ubiquinone biosynthesis protein UbiE [Bdellovibrio bacteriovorus]BEV69812.1 Demethylmenaquinone methyltransferase [Bde